MEYAGLIGHRYSEDAGEDVAILLYKSKSSAPYCECTRCGKMIRRTMYVIQSADTDVELMYLGADCYKRLK